VTEERTKWKTIRVKKKTYELLNKSAALMTLEDGEKHSLNEAIEALLEFAPGIEQIDIIVEDLPEEKT
jgi:2-phospho-L-lactate guanylyltransferase (CobY/MobA/RfbA family)